MLSVVTDVRGTRWLARIAHVEGCMARRGTRDEQVVGGHDGRVAFVRSRAVTGA